MDGSRSRRNNLTSASKLTDAGSRRQARGAFLPLLLVLLLAPGGRARAQLLEADTLSGERAFVLGGAAFTSASGGSSAPAWLAQIGLGWECPRWGLGARLGALYSERRRRGVDPVPGCGSRCARANRWFVAGALAEGSFDVRRSRNLRPFLSAGVGAVQSDIKERVGYMCNPLTQTCVITDGSTLAYSDERASLALSGGAGFETRLWRANLLGEARVFWRSNRGGAPATMVPVTIGLRF